MPLDLPHRLRRAQVGRLLFVWAALWVPRCQCGGDRRQHDPASVDLAVGPQAISIFGTILDPSREAAIGAPLLVSTEVNNGRIVYTTFHTDQQVNAKMTEILRYIVFAL